MCSKLLNFSTGWNSECFVMGHISPTENFMNCDLICLITIAAEATFVVEGLESMFQFLYLLCMSL